MSGTATLESISELLRYKTKVELKNANGRKTVGTVWVRLLGDYDLQLSYRLARIASSKKRSLLRTLGTVEYQDEIEPIPVLNTREDCIALIKASKTSGFTGEAYAQVDREEPPKVEEVAEEPDAPTLEEQEELDTILITQKSTYQERVKTFVDERLEALDGELAAKSNDEIFDMTKFEMSNILALQEFQNELVAQKAFRSTFTDERCKNRAFNDMEDYLNTHTSIKNQLIEAYNDLELSPDEIKN